MATRSLLAALRGRRRRAGGAAGMTVREARLAALARARRRREEGGPMNAAMPIDAWRLVSRRFAAEGLGESETLFAVANGYMGMRGMHDEGLASHDPPVFLNGLHENR